ncbi:hypothetical protein C8P66_101307 [Humitalea rosea]|uniref:Uncharacterized protein n=1 Tax=Humitalea rosea TaxID=990373 RepID=A0A2W7IUF3_9PROT|nr:hypothetical protein [Humitalea rosea]PZW51089.1 hypothetical protein C8P66_101307 [Humitalea rosea]
MALAAIAPKALDDFAYAIIANSPDDFATQIAADIATFRGIIQQADIRIE